MAAAGARPGRVLDEWVVVIEATIDRNQGSFEFPMIQDLLGRLEEWRSSGRYDPRRYAVQLRISADAPDEALRRAVAYHDLAARAVGLPTSCVTRAEVLTLSEFELGELPAPAPAPSVGPATRNQTPLVSEELYTATRALLWALTPAEITEVVVRFVIAVGGSIHVGQLRPVADMVAVDVSLGGGAALHAVAETMSVAGLIIEQSLPWLIGDARVRCHLDGVGD